MTSSLPRASDDCSREAYEECLQLAKERGHWAMYNAMLEDGYDPKVKWRKLMSE